MITEAPLVLGHTMAREYTPPLVSGPPGPCGCGCALTPETSVGFEFETFCSVIVYRPLDPWQRWLAIHGLELLPDGRPRFRQILVLVARQNGKTELLVLLSLFWLYKAVGMILGTSTKLDYARESWLKVVKIARAELNDKIQQVRAANGEQEIAFFNGGRYKIATSNDSGGRSLTVARLVEDELRQHHDWSAHDAAENAMNAEPYAQAWAISNAGDEESVVLNALQDQALTYITTGVGDRRLGYFGYTALPGCEVTDLEALAAANPNLGYRIDPESLLGRAERARLAGGEQEAGFRTEVLCQRVQHLSTRHIPDEAWTTTEAVVPKPTTDPVFFVTVGKEMSTAAIFCAWRVNGRPHAELVDYRPGAAWITARLGQLHLRHPGSTFGAYAAGPMRAWVPTLAEAGIDLQTLTGPDTAAACAHLQQLAEANGFTHTPDTDTLASLRGAEHREMEGGGWTWDWRASSSDLAPIASATGALWLLETQPTIEAWGFYE